MYDYACIEMKNVHNATFPLVLRRWYDSEITERRKYLQRNAPAR